MTSTRTKEKMTMTTMTAVEAAAEMSLYLEETAVILRMPAE